MKRGIESKLLALILANIIAVIVSLAIPSASIFGQELPKVVDNSAWFPPVRDQQVMPDCSHFSLIYFLKSYLWNRHFNRDPLREENQFNHNFVWNQNVGIYSDGAHFSTREAAFLFIASQGCASVADFPINELTEEIFPGLEVREKALSYRSKRLSEIQIFPRADSLVVYQQLLALKDSLRAGNCFTVGIRMYDYFFDLSDDNNVYNWYKGKDEPNSWRNSHSVTVTGYNDTIKTAEGRGAFKVINSNLDYPEFYLDYNWFFARYNGPDWCIFLEEDFTYKPELWLYLDLGSAITGEDIFCRKNIFVDAVFAGYIWRLGSDVNLDFKDLNSYFLHPNFVQVRKINGIEIPVRNEIVFVPLHNHDGNHKILADLTDYVRAGDFQLMEVLVCDPVSASFVGADDSIIYSYTREARASVNETYIKFADTNQRLVGRVVDLPDTTVICENFYSVPAAFHLTPPGDLTLVKKSVSTFKRKLIVFDINDGVTGVEEDSGFPQGYVLNQNYPNPFNPTTEISFALPNASHVTLEVFNALGQKVATLVDEKKGAGSYQVRWDGAGFPSGVYFYRLETQGFTKTIKMLLVK